MHNKELKQDLIVKEVYQQYCETHNAFFISGLDPSDRSLYPFLNDAEYKACEQLRKAKQQQRGRIIKWLQYYMQQKDLVIMFGTQSFNDEALQRSFQARAKQIQLMLTQFVDYVSNVDYGKENEREHYHFIAIARPEQVKEVDWSINKLGRVYSSSIPCTESFLKLGWQNWQVIDQNDPRICEKLSAYEAKLVNHSLKVHQTKLGYKRKSPYQAFLADMGAVRLESKKKGGLTEKDYENGYKWLENRQMMEWLEDPLTYSMP